MVRDATSASRPSRRLSATRSFIELLPTSITAARMCFDPSEPVVRGRDEERELALEARPGQAVPDVAGRTDPERLMELCYLLCDADDPLRAKGGNDVVHGLRYPVAALVEGDRVGEVPVFRIEREPGGGLRGKEPGEEKTVGRKAARAEDGGEGGRSRHGNDGKPTAAAGAHDAEARVAQAWRAGVGRERDGLSRGDEPGQALRGLGLIVLMVGHEFLPDPEPLE